MCYVTYMYSVISYKISCCVSDPPGKPGRPEVVDYDKDQAEIKWTPSKSDGGNPIQKYVIEKKAKGGEWEKVNWM